MKNLENYSIGLDIGTHSVGWCVIDKEFNLIKFRKKNMWGVRLFEEGNTAAGARVKRGQRRRYARRRERIRLLQELIGQTILEKDSAFFIRLEDSFLWKEDKRLQNTYTLFNEKQYSDSDYYKQYPTIYHLREALLHNKEQVDPRFIYLALHHMIKYRGNFLHEGQAFNTSTDNFVELLTLLGEELRVYTEVEVGEKTLEAISDTLEKKELRRGEKRDNIKTSYINEGMDKKVATELSKAILGYKADISVLLGDKELIDELGKGITVEFSSAQYEEQIEELQNRLQEQYSVIERMKQIYSQYVLNNILSGKQYISEAMVAKYNKHHEDLMVLKRLVKTYAQSEYYKLFRAKDTQSKNYVNYIKGDKLCNQEELYKTIKGILKQVPETQPEYSYCVKEMEELRFLVRLNNRENGNIPYQMNELEMKVILANQAIYYPEIKENQEKIMSLLTFRIPYYVGPLNPQSRFAWLARTNEKLYPWNFEQVVDLEQSAENFITRMTNFCTYLPEEKVIPKASLLYSKFMVLNELNGIKINGKRLENEDKQKIINDLFIHYRKITDKKLCQWLEKQQYPGGPEYKVTGYQKENEFASSLGSYLDFYKIFNKIDSTNEKMIEQIIYWLTIFEEKSIVESKIKKEYGEYINEYQLKKILRLKVQGWSRLSRKLLTGIRVNENEQYHDIMYYLEHTHMNFMQIINHKQLGFDKKIEAYQQRLKGDKITIEDVMGLQGSPAIKKGIWQTVKIIEEIRGIMGHDPTQIYIEVAREDGEKVRTKTRKNKLEEAYSKLKEEVGEYNTEVAKALKNKKYSERLDEEKVYLYFIQNGKCMYSGEPLNLECLNQYQVDHIIPQCYIKDDSFENKVLVLSTENQRKLDSLLLNEIIQRKNHIWWEKLYKHGLMGTKKYNNLTRKAFSEQEQKGFINRQLVETRQICKHIAVLLQDSFVNTQVVITKAELSHHFRLKYELYKSRSINDYHHAQDAYLAALIGQALLLNKDTDNAEWIYNQYVTKYKRKGYNRTNNFGYAVGLFDKEIIDDQGCVVWEGTHSLEKVMKIFNYKDCSITKKLEENTDQFYDETIYGHDSGKTMIPLKAGLDVNKYGGYSGRKNAYSVVVEYTNRKKREKKIVGVPVQVAYDLKSGKRELITYLLENGYKEVKVLRNRVLKHQLIEEKGSLQYIVAPNEVCNGKQLILDKLAQQVVHKIENRIKSNEEEYEEQLETTYNKIIDKIGTQYSMYGDVLAKLQQKVVFEKLDIQKKESLIIELLKMTRANSQNANLKSIQAQLPDRGGRKSKYNVDVQNTYFIDQSITGLYERRCKF